jgi:hypothetical protein
MAEGPLLPGPWISATDPASLFDGRRAPHAVPAHPPVPMPNTRRSAAPDAAPIDPVATVRSRADALYRGAIECCRQHDRAAKLFGNSDPELEHKHADAMCAMCDGSLVELSQAYEGAAARVQLEKDAEWWHKANALWHASREFQRRHAGCDALSKRLSSRHSPEQLATMQMEYELEASSLLALRQAAEAYRKTRPELV